MKWKHKPLGTRWHTWGITLGGGIVALYALTTRLISTAPVLSPTESVTLQTSNTWHAILTNPLNLPLKVLQRLTMLLPGHHAVLYGRLPSVTLAFISFLLFMHLTNRWYGRRGMVLGCAMFVSSAWFLHVGRFEGTDILYLVGILALLTTHVMIHDHSNRPLATYGWLAVNLILICVPGLMWFILLGAIWQWRTLRVAWVRLGTNWNRGVWSLIAASGIGVVTFVCFRHTGLIQPWLGLPAHILPWQTTLRQIGNSFTTLVWRGPHDPELWLAQLPLLDILGIAMLITGVLFYAKHWRAQRTHLLASYLALGGILAGLGGAVRLSVILPTIYIVVAAGIAYMLHFWLRVFPRNPIARGIGITLISAVIGISCFYNLRQYFVAWPHNPETAAVVAHQT